MASRPFQFLEKNAPKSERERSSTLRDWPPCLPVQRDGGRRSRTGVNPFISALTVARCPATFPGVWPQLRDTLSTSRSVGRGTGAFIYLPPFSENSPIFCSFPFAKIQPVFLPEQTGRIKHRPPFPPPATPAGITHYTLQAKSCANGGKPPLETPTRKGGMLPPPRGAYRLFLLSSPPATVSVEQKSAWDWCGIFNYGKLPAPIWTRRRRSRPALPPAAPVSGRFASANGRYFGQGIAS